MPQLYASECCGVVFAAGFGADNIIDNAESDVYEAQRNGKCPNCRKWNPDLKLLEETDSLLTADVEELKERLDEAVEKNDDE